MRPRTLLALVSAFLTSGSLTGCLVPSHDSFTTPQDTVLTFQSAFARDDEFREYDCFSRERRDEGLTQQVWSTARTQLFAPFGAIGRFVLRRNSLADNLAGGTLDRREARLVYELLGHGLEVELVPEAVLVLPNPIAQREDAWTLTMQTAFVDRTIDLVPGNFVAVIDVSRELAKRYESDGVAWAELRNQWKVRSVAPRTDDAPPAAALPVTAAERMKTLQVGAIRPLRLSERLGVVRLRFQFPLSTSDCNHLDPQDLLADAAFDRFRWEAARR